MVGFSRMLLALALTIGLAASSAPRSLAEIIPLLPRSIAPLTAVTPANATILYNSIDHSHSEGSIVQSLVRQSLQRQSAAKSIELVVTLNNLAWLYDHQALYSNAEANYLRALRVLHDSPGDNEVLIAVIEQNLADMYSRRNLQLRALSYYRRSLSCLERRLGLDAPETREVRKKYDVLRTRFIAPSGQWSNGQR